MKPGPEQDSALAFPKDHPQCAEVSDALVRAGAARTLPDLYEAWLKLKLARAAAAAERVRERERLEVRASFTVGAVQQARQLGKPEEEAASGGLAAPGELDGFLARAQAELAAAREGLDRRGQQEERFFDEQIARVKGEIEAMAEALLSHHQPRVSARILPVAPGRALAHLERPADDDAVLLAWLLSGRLPTRHGAFFDDAADDAALEPPRFYPDEGLERVRFGSPDEEDAAALPEQSRFAPVKGMFVFEVPGRRFPRFRLVNRGPLSEVEAREEGGGYSNLLSRAAAELFTGRLIRLQVEGRIALDLRVS